MSTLHACPRKGSVKPGTFSARSFDKIVSWEHTWPIFSLHLISLDIQTIQLLTGFLLEKSPAVLQKALWHPPSEGVGAYQVAHLSSQAKEHCTSAKHLCLVHQKKWMQMVKMNDKN